MFPGLDLYHAGPTQPLTTAGNELDDTDNDMSILSAVCTVRNGLHGNLYQKLLVILEPHAGRTIFRCFRTASYVVPLHALHTVRRLDVTSIPLPACFFFAVAMGRYEHNALSRYTNLAGAGTYVFVRLPTSLGVNSTRSSTRQKNRKYILH